MTAPDDAELPRLPDRPPTPAPVPPPSERSGSGWTAADALGATSRSFETETFRRRVNWTEYEEPTLFDIRRAATTVIAARVVVAGAFWSVVVVALLVRAEDGAASTRPVMNASLVVVLAAAVAAGAGWFWSDRVTRDIHLLGGRLPSRARCVSAWVLPLIVVGAVWATVLRLEPTEVVDVRPMVAALLFVAVAWRPYSLVRRMLRSLIRVDSDLAVGSGYLLDLSAFGLLWARVASLPAEVGADDRGVMGNLVGLSAVAAIAASANVAVWWILARDVERGFGHRRLAMRTRHQHRQLRLAGVDPFDPAVRHALLQIQMETQAAQDEAVGASRSSEPASVDEDPLDRVTSVGFVTAPPNPVGVVGADEAEAPDAAPTNRDGEIEPDTEATGVGSSEAADEEAADEEAADEEAAVAEIEPPDADAEPEPEPVRARVVLPPLGPAEWTLLERLERLGIEPSSRSIPDDGAPSVADGRPRLSGRRYSLELARYLLLLAAVACTAAAGWFVTVSLGVGDLVLGEIEPDALGRLDDARLLTVWALVATLALVPVWCATAVWWANRVGVDMPGAASCVGSAVVSAALIVVGVVADPSGPAMTFVVAGCLGAALWACSVMIRVERRLGRSATLASLLPYTLGMAVFTAVVGGFAQPLETTTSLDSLSFFGGLLAVATGFATIVAMVSTGGLVEAIELSPVEATRRLAADDGERPSTVSER